MSEESEWEADEDPLSDPEERQHFYSVLDSFRQYRRAAHFITTHVRRQNFYALPSKHWTFLSKAPFSYLDTLSRVDDAIDVNADLAEAILTTGTASFGPAGGDKASDESCVNTATKLNLDKARSTLHQLYRDWSAEGSLERDACHGPIMRDLAESFTPQQLTNENGVRVLVPGAGLGRLVFDLCCAGYQAEGNEISYHQLLTSSFVLNHTTVAEEWALYPWVMSFSNNLNREHQFRKVKIPDVHPASALAAGSMNMTAGDFCVIYSRQEYEEVFDAVATVFFIDTAPNLITYIETVRNCLRTGGVWSNVGPLLWHFGGRDQDEENPAENGNDAKEAQLDSRQSRKSAKIGSSGSIELSHDEVVKLMEHYGFEFVKHDPSSIATGYIGNPKSMLQSQYWPSHWLAVKK